MSILIFSAIATRPEANGASLLLLTFFIALQRAAPLPFDDKFEDDRLWREREEWRNGGIRRGRQEDDGEDEDTEGSMETETPVVDQVQAQFMALVKNFSPQLFSTASRLGDTVNLALAVTNPDTPNVPTFLMKNILNLVNGMKQATMKLPQASQAQPDLSFLQAIPGQPVQRVQVPQQGAFAMPPTPSPQFNFLQTGNQLNSANDVAQLYLQLQQQLQQGSQNQQFLSKLEASTLPTPTTAMPTTEAEPEEVTDYEQDINHEDDAEDNPRMSLSQLYRFLHVLMPHIQEKFNVSSTQPPNPTKIKPSTTSKPPKLPPMTSSRPRITYKQPQLTTKKPAAFSITTMATTTTSKPSTTKKSAGPYKIKTKRLTTPPPSKRSTLSTTLSTSTLSTTTKSSNIRTPLSNRKPISTTKSPLSIQGGGVRLKSPEMLISELKSIISSSISTPSTKHPPPSPKSFLSSPKPLNKTALLSNAVDDETELSLEITAPETTPSAPVTSTTPSSGGFATFHSITLPPGFRGQQQELKKKVNLNKAVFWMNKWYPNGVPK